MSGNMSGNWIEWAQGVLTLIAAVIATVVMPGRIWRFLRTLNSDRVLYPTPLLRDMAVLFVIGFAAGIAGALALDWMLIERWEPGSLIDVSHVFEGNFVVVVLWQCLILVPVLPAVVLMSERGAKRRLAAAGAGAANAVDGERLRQVAEVHASGDTPIDNPVVLPGAVLILADWALARWAGGVPFSFAMHLVAWALPMGLALASLRLIGVRL